MYYVLIPKPDTEGNIMGFTYQKDHPLRSWMGGVKFSQDKNAPVFKREPSVPIKLILKPGRENVMKADFLAAPLPIMSRKLLSILADAGVDNIDEYAVDMCDVKGNRIYDDYYAVNIVGKMAVADLEKSISDTEQSDSMISKSFDALSIDGEQARGAKLFRLAENVSVIVVSNEVKNKLDEHLLKTIELLEPESIAAL